MKRGQTEEAFICDLCGAAAITSQTLMQTITKH